MNLSLPVICATIAGTALPLVPYIGEMHAGFTSVGCEVEARERAKKLQRRLTEGYRLLGINPGSAQELKGYNFILKPSVWPEYEQYVHEVYGSGKLKTTTSRPGKNF
eukprot:GHVU01106372.1.p1 GENE.GHVU01106372.1~~GHVU01106372.1.p1  ORF type:complete len:107 (-),score=5.38 GHVU01106372.1:193-513(-)